MVWSVAAAGERHAFAETPWSERSAEWQLLDRRLPAGHLARRIARVVDQLDLEPLFASYRGVGKKPLRPDLLLKMVLYELHNQRLSPAQWARDVRDNQALQWLLFGMQPSRARLYDYRDRLAPFLPAWHAQVLQEAMNRKITTADRAALDGSAVAACAARRQLLNQERIEQRLTAIRTALKRLVRGETLPSGPHWLGRTRNGLRGQLCRYQRAAHILNERLRANSQRRRCDRKPSDKILVSPGDPESVLARDKWNVFRPLYSVQLLRDLDSPLIFSYDVLPQNNDNGVMGPLLEQMTHHVGRKPLQLLVDAGYVSLQHLELCEQTGITLYGPCQANDFTASRGKRPQSNQYTQLPKSAFRWLPGEQTYECPQGHHLHFARRCTQRRLDSTVSLDLYVCPPEHCLKCPQQPACTPTPHKGRCVSRMEHEELLDALRSRMETEEARQLYRHRSRTVELNYADLKEHRGLRRFHGRGRTRAATEVGLLILVHNLLCVEAHARKPSASPANPPEPPLLHAA